MNGQERAKTRPDGNDPKEFRGPPFLSSFLFLLLRFATSSFLHTFSPLSSLPPTYLALSFFLFPTWDNRERVEATDTERGKAKTSSDGSDFGIFVDIFFLRAYFFSIIVSLHLKRGFIFAYSPL